MIRFLADATLITAQAGDATQPARISGLAVPWDVVATVSDGTSVRFTRGAFDVGQKPAKLIENHDITQLRGVVSVLTDTEAGLEFEAILADTRASRDAVALLKAGAYDSVSVGAEPITATTTPAGVTTVTKAILRDLSLVARPAYIDAVITKVAATAPEPEPETETEEHEMSDTIPAPPVEVTATIPTNPIIYAEARRPFVMPTPAEYISAFLSDPAKLAAMHAGIQAAAPDVVTTDVPGILPVPIIQPVYSNFVGTRPVVDAVGARAMPSGGKVFIRPKITTHTTMGGPVAEMATLPDGTLVITDLTVQKEIFGGFCSLSEAVIDWTVPEVIGVLIDDMGRIYANETDAVAAAALFAGTTQTEGLANFADPADWATFVGNSAVQILSSSNGNLPTHLFLSPDSWGFLMALTDSTGRPLFPALGPMNAMGSLAPSDGAGLAFGLRVVVDRNFAAATAIVGDSSGFEVYEQQKGAISVDVPSTLSRTIAWRGYFSTLMLDDTRFVAAV